MVISSKLIDPKKTVVLAIDIQNAYCSPQGRMAKFGHNLFHMESIIEEINYFIVYARKKKIPIIFTRFIEDPEYMKENARIKMKSLSVGKIVSPNTSDFEYYKIKPEKSDYEIIKKSYDSFSNPRLNKLLKTKRISNIIIIGAYSDLCVDMTLRSAYTIGYNVVVPLNLVSTTKSRLERQKIIISSWDQFFAHTTSSKQILTLWSKK